jgi:hypothetical protein
MASLHSTPHRNRSEDVWRTLYVGLLVLLTAFVVFLFAMMIVGATDGWNPNSS